MTDVIDSHILPPAVDKADIDSRVISLLKPDSFEADQYRMLRHAIERACPAPSSRVIAVTSAVAGDGKTLTAVNLAATIGRGGQSRVLLIDADFRRPSVSRVLGRPGAHSGWGFAGAVENGKLSLDQVVWRINAFNLAVATSGRPRNDTYELLTSPRFGELIQQAREKFDFIILDTPPVLPAPDSRLLAEVIDGYVIVVGADKTPRKLLEETLAVLGPGKILGLIFNRESHKHSRYAKYYYAYHERR